MHVTESERQGHLPVRACRIAIERADRDLRRAESVDRAVRTVERSLGEIARKQPFAIYLDEGSRFSAVAVRSIDASPSFDARGTLVRYLRAHPRPVMAARSRRGRAMLASLDAGDREALRRLGAVALVPLLELGRLVGFIVVGGLRWSGGFDSVDPVLATELASSLSGAFSRLRARDLPADSRGSGVRPGVVLAPQPS